MSKLVFVLLLLVTDVLFSAPPTPRPQSKSINMSSRTRYFDNQGNYRGSKRTIPAGNNTVRNEYYDWRGKPVGKSFGPK